MPKPRPKIEPTVLRYASRAELPPIEEIVRLSQTKLYLIFEIAAKQTVTEVGQPVGNLPLLVGAKYFDAMQAERELLVRELTVRLPDWSVWETYFTADNVSPTMERQVGSELTGTVKIIVQFAISQQDKENYLSMFLLAALRYEEIINPLMTRMAKRLGVEIFDFTNTTRGRESWWHKEQVGVLKVTKNDPVTAEEWKWFFHGHDCGLTSRKGVHIEALLGGGAEYGQTFGVLRPFFFWEFIKTNEPFAPLVDLLGGHGGNTGHFLQYAERLGFLQQGSRGWILTDAGRQRANEARTESGTDDA